MARISQGAMSRRVPIAQALLAIIVVVGALAVAQMMISGPLFAKCTDVTLELPDAAGLHPRSIATYRGQNIGSVSEVSLTPQGVSADLCLDADVNIPRDTLAVVANLSAVGEQYVDFRPRTDNAPYLASGDVITSRDSGPLPTWQALSDLQQLLDHVDTKDIATLGRETRRIFRDGDVDLGELVTQVRLTLDLVQNVGPDLLALAEEGEAPLAALDDLNPEVRTLIRNSRQAAKALRASNKSVATILDKGATLLPIVIKDFKSATPVLVKMLEDGTPVAVMARDHIPGLKHWLKWGPTQLDVMADSTRDGAGHVVLVITTADNCRYSENVSPYQKDVKLPTAARCTTDDPNIQQRGSKNVPRQ